VGGSGEGEVILMFLLVKCFLVALSLVPRNTKFSAVSKFQTLEKSKKKRDTQAYVCRIQTGKNYLRRFLVQTFAVQRIVRRNFLYSFGGQS